MLRLWFTLALVVLSFVRLHAAVAVVQSTSCTGNDATCTLGGAPSSSNIVVVWSVMPSTSQTLDLTGNDVAETSATGNPQTGTNFRTYAWCMGGTTDTTVTVTTSAGAVAHSAVAEISGAATCAGDSSFWDDADFTEATGSSQALATDLTASASGDWMPCIVSSNSTADFTASNTPDATIQASNVEIGTLTLASHKIQGGAGSYDCTFTSAASETYHVAGWLILAAGGGGGGNPLPAGSLHMLGVGK